MSLRRFHIFEMLIGVTAALATTAMGPNRLWAQATEITEYRAKATYLVWFAQRANWLDTDFAAKDSPLVLVILGENPFEKEMEFYKSKLIKNRKIEVKVVKNAEDVPACHILFVSSSEKRNLAKTLKPFKDRRVLTISDIDGFIQEGGIASVVVKQTGVVVSKPIPDINKKAAARVGLEFTPELYAAVKSLQDKYR
jgi:hypothetical protein